MTENMLLMDGTKFGYDGPEQKLFSIMRPNTVVMDENEMQ